MGTISRLFYFGLGVAFGVWLCMAGFRPGEFAQLRLPGLGAAATATPLLPLPPGAVLDQASCEGPVKGMVPVGGEVWKAQTFVSGRTGRLVRVVLQGQTGSGTAVLHLRHTDAAGRPAAMDLAATGKTRGTVFEFGPGIALEAGKRYALVVSVEETVEGFGWHYADAPDCYPNPDGHPFTSTDGGRTWSQDIVDFIFATYVVP